MALMQAVLDSARKPLNDAAKTRWPDADLLEYANEAVKILWRERPDLFFGSLSALPTDKTVSEAFPIGEEYLSAVRDYVVARAETRDDEEALQARAALFFQLFQGALKNG